VPTETSDGELIRKPGKMLVQRALRSGANSDLVFQTISELPLQPTLKEGRGEQATAKDILSNILNAGTADFAIYAVLARDTMENPLAYLIVYLYRWFPISLRLRRSRQIPCLQES